MTKQADEAGKPGWVYRVNQRQPDGSALVLYEGKDIGAARAYADLVDSYDVWLSAVIDWQSINIAYGKVLLRTGLDT